MPCEDRHRKIEALVSYFYGTAAWSRSGITFASTGTYTHGKRIRETVVHWLTMRARVGRRFGEAIYQSLAPREKTPTIEFSVRVRLPVSPSPILLTCWSCTDKSVLRMLLSSEQRCRAVCVGCCCLSQTRACAPVPDALTLVRTS
eukprot:336579-Rhodomonas_salina.1